MKAYGAEENVPTLLCSRIFESLFVDLQIPEKNFQNVIYL